jgi:hypothetical protein
MELARCSWQGHFGLTLFPFALSLSKGGYPQAHRMGIEGFDKLSPNGMG